MDGNQGVPIGAILSLVHCRDSNSYLLFFITCSNHNTDGFCERPGKLDSCLIFSVVKAAITKAHQYIFIPGIIQGQVGWDSEQPDLVEDVPAHCRGVGLDGL